MLGIEVLKGPQNNTVHRSNQFTSILCAVGQIQSSITFAHFPNSRSLGCLWKRSYHCSAFVVLVEMQQRQKSHAGHQDAQHQGDATHLVVHPQRHPACPVGAGAAEQCVHLGRGKGREHDDLPVRGAVAA